MQQNKEIKSVSIVGTGNVGWHLALAINCAGLEVRHIISRSLEKAEELANIVSAEPLLLGSKKDSLSDLVILCVKDDVLPKLLTELHFNNTLLVHTSGGTGMDILSDSSSDFGVLYPLQTFSRQQNMDYKSIPFLIEGASEVIEERLSKLAEKISGSFFLVNSDKRRKIHLAAVFSCNFSNHMFSIATKILEEEGLESELLLPLMKQTLSKLEKINPIVAQTGPAVRDDQEIINTHLELLAEKPAEYKIYKLLSENILRYKKEHE